MLLRRELNLVRRHSRWVDPPLSSTLFFNTNNNPSKCVRFDQPPHATNPISYQDFLLLLVRASKKQKQSMTRGWWVGRVWEEGKKSTSTWNEIAEPTAGPKQKKKTRSNSTWSELPKLFWRFPSRTGSLWQWRRWQWNSYFDIFWLPLFSFFILPSSC